MQPFRLETSKCSADSQLEGKLHNVVGLYVSEFLNAVVFGMDKKAHIQLL